MQRDHCATRAGQEALPPVRRREENPTIIFGFVYPVTFQLSTRRIFFKLAPLSRAPFIGILISAQKFRRLSVIGNFVEEEEGERERELDRKEERERENVGCQETERDKRIGQNDIGTEI